MSTERAEAIMLNGLVEITGLSHEELAEIRSDNLFELGILDSLAMGGLISWLDDETGFSPDLSKCRPEDFSSVDALIGLLKAAC